MSVKDTYKGWKTTLLGLAVQGLIGYVWFTGVQPVEMWSVILFLAGFGLWMMPDTVISTIKKRINEPPTTGDYNGGGQDCG